VELQQGTLSSPPPSSNPSGPSGLSAPDPTDLTPDLRTLTSDLEAPTPTGVIEDSAIVSLVQRTGEQFRMPDGQIVEKMINGSYQLERMRNNSSQCEYAL
jgi:hypothetical protein